MNKLSRYFHAVSAADTRLIFLWLSLVVLAIFDFYTRILDSFEPPPPPNSGADPAYSPLVIEKPPEEWDSLIGKDSAPGEPKEKEEEFDAPRIDESSQNGELDVLVLNGVSYELQACFLTNEERAAILKRRNDGKSPTIELVRQGGQLGPYTASYIDRTSVELRASDGRQVKLRLFTPTNQESEVKNK